MALPEYLPRDVTVRVIAQEDGGIVFRVAIGVIAREAGSENLVIIIEKELFSEPCRDRQEALQAMLKFSTAGIMSQKNAIACVNQTFPLNS